MIIDKLSGSRVRFEVTITKELFEHALDHAFEEKNKEVEIKGFRKGHAPRSVYEAKFGVESLFEEAINHAIQDTYYDTVTENNLSPVAQPKIDLDVPKVKRGVDFTYVVTVAVKPAVTLGQYLGVEVKRASNVATPAEVDAEIAKELNRNAEMVLKEEGALQNGDTAVFDYSGTVDGVKFEGGTAVNHELVIGSGQFIPGFEEQMVGMSVETEKDIQVTFPETYHEKTLAGKAAVFAVKLHEIKTRQIPSLSDDFVKDLNLDGVANVAEYRSHVLKNLESEKAVKNENDVANQAIAIVTANATLEIPEEMVKEEAARMNENTMRQIKQYGLDFDTYLQYMGKTKEAYDADIDVEASKNLRSQLVVEAIGKVANLEVTKEDVETKYLEIVEQYKSQKVTIEQAKAATPLSAVEEEVRFHNAVDLIVSSVKLIQ